MAACIFLMDFVVGGCGRVICNASFVPATALYTPAKGSSGTLAVSRQPLSFFSFVQRIKVEVPLQNMRKPGVRLTHNLKTRFLLIA